MARPEKTVFISYRRKDIAWALNVYRYLTNRGYDVFFDYTSISSGAFDQVIISNIKARAHFLVILTPSALDRCSEPGDWLRREIETAILEKRNIIPLFFDDFNFSSPAVSEKLTGQLALLKQYNGLEIPAGFFDEAMDRLSKKYLNVALQAVLHPISDEVQEVVKKQKAAASQAMIEQKVKVEQPAKKSKKQLFGIYARLAILAMMFLGFLGPWFKVTACTSSSEPPAAPKTYSSADVITEVFSDSVFLLIMGLVITLLFLFILIRLLAGSNKKAPVFLERIFSGLGPLCVILMAIGSSLALMGRSVQMQWGLGLLMIGVHLSPISLLIELGLTKQKGKRWPAWGWLLIVSLLLVPLVILIAWVASALNQ